MRGERLLHLHRLEDDDEIAGVDLLTLAHLDLDDRALHRCGDGIAGGAAGSLLRAALLRAAGLRTAATTECEIARERDLQPLAADLDDERLPRDGVTIGIDGAGVRGDGVVEAGLDPAGVHLERGAVVGRERRVAHDDAMERQRRRDALDLELVERPARPLQCLVAVLAGDDELGEQGVEVAADDIALAEAGVDAHAWPARRVPGGEHARGRQEAAAGILAVNAELDRVSTQRRVVVVDDPALGDTELLAHEVNAGDLLGHRVLDLQAGVDLEEGDRAVLADEELAGAGIEVAGLLDDRLARRVQLLELVVGEVRRGRLLDELLVTALQRAVAGRDDDDVSVLVGEHLRLDVTRVVEVALDEALTATECRDGLANRGVVQLRDLLDGARDLQTATATTERGLDRDGKPVLLRERNDLLSTIDRVGGAGNLRRTCALGDVPRGDLVAEIANGLRRRADPDEPCVDDGLREVGVLGQEAVAGVNGIGTGLLRDIDDLVDDEVRLRCRAAAEGVGMVGELHVEGIAVRVGVHRH